MNAGITLAYQGQRLIGSGVAFTYDETKMRRTIPGILPDGQAIVAAGTAPIITNTNASGDGITMAASDTEVAGVTVSGASRFGTMITGSSESK